MATRARGDEQSLWRRRPKTFAAVLVLVSSSAIVVSSCTSATGRAGHVRHRAAAATGAASVPPTVVPRSVGGSPGAGPVVVPPGRDDTAVLPDRTLTVASAVRAPSASATSVSIRVDVAIRNPGTTAIANDSASYRLLGSEGDVFAATPDGPATVAARATGTATISFEVPAAATSSLQLLYRPAPQARAVLIPLKVG